MKKTHKKPFKAKLKHLFVVTMGVMSSLAAQASTKGHGDLEIYQPAQQGGATITMMLDISTSMWAVDTPTGSAVLPGSTYMHYSGRANPPVCVHRRPARSENIPLPTSAHDSYGNTLVPVTVPITDVNGTVINSITFTIRGCPARSGEKLRLNSTYTAIENGYGDRMTNLRIGLISLLADGKKLDAKHKIGMGHFPNTGSSRGTIQRPALPLTDAHRINLINYVANLHNAGSTPMTNALGEAAAYMFGRNSGTHGGFSSSDPSTKNGANYRSPIDTQSQCSGHGIYFLTDGAPNSYNRTNSPRILASALGRSSFAASSPTLTESGTESHVTSGWAMTSAFAREIRTNNPMNIPVKTATVGFGGVFAGFTNRTITVTDSTGKAKNKVIPNCNSTAASQDAKNLCRLGELNGGFGEGGFTSTGKSDELAASVLEFVESLNQTIPASPAGTITIPDDPYELSAQRAIAYLPMIQPDLTSNASSWQGNLKKYEIGDNDNTRKENDGTFFGKSSRRLYKDDGVTLNEITQDLWSDKDYTGANNAVNAGGVYGNLKTPTSSAGSQRVVYIEDGVDASGRPLLRKFGVSSSGKITLDGTEITASHGSGGFTDSALYTEDVVTHLLRFLGYSETTATLPFENMTITVPSVESKVLGGILHSVPSLVSYSAELDNDGQVIAGGERDEYVLFGSMSGALHMVDTDDHGTNEGGQEKFAIITKTMLLNQPEALSAGDHSFTGQPKFGVDAPWLVTATYSYDFGNKKIQIGTPTITNPVTGAKTTSPNLLSGLHAFGGFRLGAKGVYGLDLTNKDNPKLNFAISESSTGFNRIGHIWNKPVQARIKVNAADEGTDVLVFGGGYDMCYEDDKFQVGANSGSDATCNTKTQADGNAVYIINAKTGALIWSASSDASATTQVSTMKNSIVGEINVLDRNNDGFMDHLYFADLGGQMFRADFQNASTTTPFRNHTVVRVLHENEGQYNRRFYEKPVVDFYAHNGNTFGLVTVISGDRSSPLSTMRSTNDQADRLYAIFDHDMTKTDAALYATPITSTTHTTRDLRPSDLEKLGEGRKTKADVQTKNKGWYYPLIRFEGYTNAKFTKGMGKSEVVKGKLGGVSTSYLYTTVYNPDMRYTATNSCSAQIRGGSERQFYCLPYGICQDPPTSTGGTTWLAGYQRAGTGIQELAIGPADAKTKTRVLVSSMLVADHKTGYSSSAFSGASGLFATTKDTHNAISQSAITKDNTLKPDPGVGIDEAYTLIPKRWYDVSTTGN